MAESDWVDVGGNEEDNWVDVTPSKPSSWNLFDAAKQFGAGVVEGDVGLAGLAGDLNPFAPHPFTTRKPGLLSSWLGLEQSPVWGPDFSFGYSRKLKEGTDSILPEADPQYRYSRTGGQFLGPGLTALPVGLAGVGEGTAMKLVTSQATPVALASAASGSVGAQGAQDVFKDSAVAPLLGALALGSLPSMAMNSASAFKGLLTPATEQEVLGSAALAMKEATGLTPDAIQAGIGARPMERLDALQTTAERTGNAGMAQLEKTLASTGDNASQYAARTALRNDARDEVLDTMSKSSGVNTEGLGSSLIEKAVGVKNKLSDFARRLWGEFPRYTEIDAAPEQLELSSILDSRQAGRGLGSITKTLVSQFLNPKDGALTSGAMQEIRSDALELLRDANLSNYERRTLSTLQKGVDTALERNFGEASAYASAYPQYKAARDATRNSAETFAPGTAGGSLTNPNTRPSNALANVFKGDEKSIVDLRKAIDNDPALLEDVKRGILDMVPRSGVNEQLSPSRFSKFLDANEGGLKALFGEDHYGQMQKILGDLRSEAGVSEKAFLSSKGNSATSQRQTVAGAIEDIAIGSLIPNTGALGKFANTVRGIFADKNAARVKDLLFKAAMEPDFALELSKAPTNTRIFNTGQKLVQFAKDAGFFGASSATLEGARTQEALPQDRPGDALAPSPSNKSQPQGGQSSPSSPPSARSDAVGSQASLFDFLSPQTASATEVGPQDQLGQVLGIPSLNSAPSSHVNQVFDALSNAVKHVESRGNANAESPKGAIGTHQVTPIAARDVLRAQGVDDRQYSDADLKQILRQPGMSQQFGEAYLQLLIQRYNGNVELALAAYNGGPSRLDEVGRDIRKMPAETRSYVPAVFEALTRGQA